MPVEPVVGEHGHTARRERRGEAEHACRVEQQQPRIEAGQRHDRDADVSAYPRPHRQVRHLGIFVVFQDFNFAVRTMRIDELRVFIAFRVGVGVCFTCRRGGHLRARGQFHMRVPKIITANEKSGESKISQEA